MDVMILATDASGRRCCLRVVTDPFLDRWMPLEVRDSGEKFVPCRLNDFMVADSGWAFRYVAPPPQAPWPRLTWRSHLRAAWIAWRRGPEAAARAFDRQRADAEDQEREDLYYDEEDEL